MGHMHADLMGAAGLELAANQARIRRRAEILLDLIMGHRLARARPAGDAHLLARRAMAPDRRIDRAAPALGRAPDDSKIGALEASIAAMGGELFGEALMRLLGLCHDKEFRCVLVEGVDDARPSPPANAGEALSAMGDECIDEG